MQWKNVKENGMMLTAKYVRQKPVGTNPNLKNLCN